MPPRISIITAVYNRVSTVQTAIESVLNQVDANIEYIIVDGNSTDGTQNVIRRYEASLSKFISEPDTGIYNALNKGILASSGDVVGFIHADDMLANPNAIKRISEKFQDPTIDAAYGDLVYVDAEHPERIVRYWKSGARQFEKISAGVDATASDFLYSPRTLLEAWWLSEDFHISADYELILRMLFKHRLTPAYVEEVLVKMRLGGKSNVSMGNRLLANREDRRAWEVNGLKAPIGLQLFKPLRKLYQYWLRPKPRSV